MDFNVTEAMDLLHDYANQFNLIHDEIGHVYDAYGDDDVPYSIVSRLDEEASSLENLAYPVADNLKSYFLSSRHGGSRKGAGRPSKSPTQQIRIDADLADQFKAFSELYRGQTDERKALLLREFNALGVSFCQSEASSFALDDI